MQQVFAIIGSLSGAIALLVHIWNWWSDRQTRGQGASAQREKDLSISRSAETRVAMAEANAPRSDAEVDTALKAGKL